MQIECASIKCDNTFFIDETKNWKFPSKRYYCISCRKQEYKIRLKCAGCFMEFTPNKLTQKYCGGDCKVVLASRRKYQREHLVNKRILDCKICKKRFHLLLKYIEENYPSQLTHSAVLDPKSPFITESVLK